MLLDNSVQQEGGTHHFKQGSGEMIDKNIVAVRKSPVES